MSQDHANVKPQPQSKAINATPSEQKYSHRKPRSRG